MERESFERVIPRITGPTQMRRRPPACIRALKKLAAYTGEATFYGVMVKPEPGRKQRVQRRDGDTKMKFKEPIIPIALKAFCSEDGYHEDAWDLLEEESNWSPEPGSDLEESVYAAIKSLHELTARGAVDQIDSGIVGRVELLEPYRASEIPEWLT